MANPLVLTVGAADSTGQSPAAYSSSDGNWDKPNLLTYGALTVDDTIINGTAVSTAITAGIAATLWSTNPQLSAAELRDELMQHATTEHFLVQLTKPDEPFVAIANLLVENPGLLVLFSVLFVLLCAATVAAWWSARQKRFLRHVIQNPENYLAVEKPACTHDRNEGDVITVLLALKMAGKMPILARGVKAIDIYIKIDSPALQGKITPASNHAATKLEKSGWELNLPLPLWPSLTIPLNFTPERQMVQWNADLSNRKVIFDTYIRHRRFKPGATPTVSFALTGLRWQHEQPTEVKLTVRVMHDQTLLFEQEYDVNCPSAKPRIPVAPQSSPQDKSLPIGGETPMPANAQPDAAEQQPANVFISYSHEDREWLGRMRTHLKPFERRGELSVWDDTEIEPGQRWKDEIKRALLETDIAVLLVTQHFLASNFILDEELHALLKKKHIFWIAVWPGSYAALDLDDIQAANDPKAPLGGLPLAEQDAVLARIAAQIAERATRQE